MNAPETPAAGEPAAEPEIRNLIGFHGRLHLTRKLAQREEVHVQVITTTGEVVADGFGRVRLSFTDKEDDHGRVVELIRVHTARVK